MRKNRHIGIAAVLGLAASLLFGPAAAQTPEEFFRGRDVSLYIGTAAGGAYDLFGRLVARHMSRHIPGRPTIVPINMEGAGSLRLANWLYNVAPRDGTVMAVMNRGTPFEPLIGLTQLTQFDATNYTWLGSPTDDKSVCVASRQANLARFEEIYTRDLYVGSTGGGSGSDVFPKIVNGTLGTRLRIVSGYPGGNDIDFAMERGEIDARCGWSWSSIMATKKEWLDQGLITVFLQLALTGNPELPDVPLIMDLARSEEQRQIFRLIFSRETLGYPFLAPPGLPADRAAALRKAFDDTMADPVFVAEAERSRLKIDPVTGDELQALIVEAYATPRPIVEKTRAMLR